MHSAIVYSHGQSSHCTELKRGFHGDLISEMYLGSNWPAFTLQVSMGMQVYLLSVLSTEMKWKEEKLLIGIRI